MEWKWVATYKDKSQYSSEEYEWSDLPADNFIKLIIMLPAGGRMLVSGWDFYALKLLPNGLRISYWKDVIANDIDGNPMYEPYLDKGGFREFYDDGTANAVTYTDADIIKKDIPGIDIKAGIWVPDELAKELGIL